MPEDAAHNLVKTVDEITGYGRRTRALVIRAAVVAVVLFTLSGFLYVQVHDSQLNNCNAGNVSRTQQKQLWETLFALASKGSASPPSAESRKLTAEFLGDVKATYVPVDCAARYPFW